SGVGFPRNSDGDTTQRRSLTNGGAHVFFPADPGRAGPVQDETGSTMSMHRYRSHHCAELRKEDVGRIARLSGWVHRVRAHGGLLFIDLRDHHGITQIVADPDSPSFATAETLRAEWVVRVD